MPDRSLRVPALAALVVLAGLTAACRKPSAPVMSAGRAAPAAPAPAPASDAAAVEAFIKGLYAPDTIVEPKVFDAAMLALMAENARVTPKGDVGALDGDPFCDCQDSEGMRAQVAVIEVKADSATVVANLAWSGDAAPRTDRITYDLVKVDGTWRIHDISAKDMPSLRRLYIDSNAAAARPKP